MQIGETLEKIRNGATDFCNPGNDFIKRIDGMISVASISEDTTELGSPHSDIIELSKEASRNSQSPNLDQRAIWIGAKALYEVALRFDSSDPVAVYLSILEQRFGSVPRNIAKNVLESIVFDPRLTRAYRGRVMDMASGIGVKRVSTKLLFRAFKT